MLSFYFKVQNTLIVLWKSNFYRCYVTKSTHKYIENPILDTINNFPIHVFVRRFFHMTSIVSLISLFSKAVKLMGRANPKMFRAVKRLVEREIWTLDLTKIKGSEGIATTTFVPSHLSFPSVCLISLVF